MNVGRFSFGRFCLADSFELSTRSGATADVDRAGFDRLSTQEFAAAICKATFTV
jgi:hypothetical protein